MNCGVAAPRFKDSSSVTERRGNNKSSFFQTLSRDLTSPEQKSHKNLQWFNQTSGTSRITRSFLLAFFLVFFIVGNFVHRRRGKLENTGNAIYIIIMTYQSVRWAWNVKTLPGRNALPPLIYIKKKSFLIFFVCFIVEAIHENSYTRFHGSGISFLRWFKIMPRLERLEIL